MEWLSIGHHEVTWATPRLVVVVVFCCCASWSVCMLNVQVWSLLRLALRLVCRGVFLSRAVNKQTKNAIPWQRYGIAMATPSYRVARILFSFGCPPPQKETRFGVLWWEKKPPCQATTTWRNDLGVFWGGQKGPCQATTIWRKRESFWGNKKAPARQRPPGENK